MRAFRRVHLTTVSLALVAAAPVAGIALWSIGRTATELADPCAAWDYPQQQPVSTQVGPHDPCRARSLHMESKARAAMTAALVPGGLLLAAILAVAGAAASRRRVMLAAGIGMLIETLVVLSIAPLTLLAGIGVILIARRMPATAYPGCR